jgi:hypothetical protein
MGGVRDGQRAVEHATGTFGPSSQDGIVVTASAVEQDDGTFRFERPVAHPTWVDRANGHVIRPVLTDLADPTTPPEIRDQLAASLERTRRVVGDFVSG